MIDAKTLLYASIAHPNREAKSPIMYNAAFKALGLNYVFLAFEPTDLEKAIDSIRALDIRGFSVSKPYKEEAMRYLDEIDHIAQSIGAVNTILNKDEKLIGYNYDWIGAVRALEDKTSLGNKKAVVVGAGGAGRAIVFGLEKQGSRVIVYDEIVEKAREVSKEFKVEFGGDLKELSKVSDYDILINATPVGSYHNLNKSAIPESMLKEGKIIFDVVFNPLETRLLKEAKKLKCETIPGFKMLVQQGAAQFKLFTGLEPPIEVMEKSVLESL